MRASTPVIPADTKKAPGGFSSPRGVLRAGLVVAPILILIHISLLLLSKNTWQMTVINDVMPICGSLLAFLGLGYGTYWSGRLSFRSKATWRFLAIAALCMNLGDISHLIIEVFLHQPVRPAISDIFYLSSFPLFLAASIVIPAKKLSLRDIGKFGLDIAIIALSSSLILWKFLISPAIAAGAPNMFSMLVAAAYPVDDLILIWAVVMLVLRPLVGQPRQPIWLLLVTATIIVIGDTTAAGVQSSAAPLSSDWVNIVYLIMPLMLMTSGLLQAERLYTAPRIGITHSPKWETRLIQALRLTLPYLWLGGAYLVLALEPFPQPTYNHNILYGWVAIIILLVIIRQIIAIEENLHLSQALHQLNTDLERRVGERTEELSRANRDLRDEMAERARVEQILREREEKLAYDALHDALTGLPNRALMTDHLIQAIRRLRRQKEYCFALLFLDFDRFKIVNDSLGHIIGDQLLVEIGKRLLTCVREVDTVARQGGDEFVVLLEDICGEDGALIAAERLQARLVEPFDISNHRIILSASIGIVVGGTNYHQPDEILRDADLAMYEAKALGKARNVIFSPELRSHAVDRLTLETDLRSAQEHNEFRLHYQPIIAFDTNIITGFEALIRWQHPQRGLLPPGDFISIAEATGLIVPMTQWVMREACSQMVAWQNEFPKYCEMAISVNISPRLFNQPELLKMVDVTLAETGLAPNCLMLEITEGAILVDAEESKLILNSWREKGIQVHVDDFGIGYSSLSYLHQFPIDTLKIDRSFIQRIQGNGDQGEVVRTIIALARELKINVVAEGVETVEQLNFLKSLGCQNGQGFYFSRPLEPAAAKALFVKEFEGPRTEKQ